MNDISEIRKEYKLKTLDEKDVEVNAIDQFGKWWQDAISSSIDEVNAMTLATATTGGKPSARIVLLKGYDKNGFVFFTNYQSHKGKEIEQNPQASIIFFWKELERQIRIEGIVKKITVEENDAYYFSRPSGSQIGAWASPQSTIIDGRELLDENVKQYTALFQQQKITRPAHWGGYCLQPSLIEFWQGRPSRLHDRLQYSLQDEGGWLIERLAP